MKADRFSADFTLAHTSHAALTVHSDGTAQLDNADIDDFAAWVADLVRIREHVRELWPVRPRARRKRARPR